MSDSYRNLDWEWSNGVVRKMLVVVLFCASTFAGAGIIAPAYAQNGSLPTQVLLWSGTSTVPPGGTFPVTAQGTAVMYTPQLEVYIPSDLAVLSVYSCTATYSNPSDASGTTVQDLGCNAGVDAGTGPNGTNRFVARPLSNGGIGVNKIVVSFTIQVPRTATAGTTYNMSAPSRVAGYGFPAMLGITVASQRASTPEATPGPQPTSIPHASPTLIPNGATSDAPLVLIPMSLEAHPGDRITIDVDFIRLQGVSSVALWFYAENMKITNVFNEAFIDPGGKSACTPDTVGDYTQPRERSFDVFEDPFTIPTKLNLTVSPEAPIGSQLRVCMEMVIFTPVRELPSWNAFATVKVVAP